MTTPGDQTPGNPADGSPTPIDDPFLRFDARVLDPSTAVRLPGGAAPSVTAYVGDTLLVTAADLGAALQTVGALDQVARERELQVIEAPLDGWENRVRVPRHDALRPLLGEAAALGLSLVVPVRFGAVDEGGPTAPTDVWPLLQQVRNGAAQLDGAVGLDHLMFAAAIFGNPVTARGTSLITGDPVTARGTAVVNGNPVTARGTADARLAYSVPGSGGRGPVVLVAPMPDGRPGGPRVVVLDTGIGAHPWFKAFPAVRSLTTPGGSFVGLDPSDPANKDTDPDRAGGVIDPMIGVLATHSGHGTFISGLLRQTCPDAEIAALRIMDADGVVPEATLAAALTGLAVTVRSGWSLDALVLSLGYYSETADDATYTAGIAAVLADLGSDGVVTFAAAGNDASTQRSYPAAFATDPGWPAKALPVVSVAAENPDRSIALFSNDGCWVTAQAPGANVVSTMPITFDGAQEAEVATVDDEGHHRATIDADDFSAGFATWSGTSFAAPIAAGRYLHALHLHGMPSDPDERRKLLPLR